MLSFLFWNINNKELQDSITRIALLHKVDIIILTECSISTHIMLEALNQHETSYHYVPSIGCKKIEIFTNFPAQFIPAKSETPSLTVRHLALPGMRDVLLAAIHFPSKLHWDDSSQATQCVELSNSIKDVEQRIGHSRTVLVGDFNMNPFEDGVVNANGLHAVMTRTIAQRGKRIVQSQEYPIFYNPMWGFFGDRQPGPPGTYYYENSAHKVFFWNMFDQVLIRPDLISLFDNDNLKILDFDGEHSLISNRGIPDKNNASDHLPILFRIDL